MWVLLVAAAAGGVLREVAHPFYDDGVEAIVNWLGLCIPGCVIAYVVVGRWKKGLTTLWKPSWRELRRILVAAPLGVLALRLLIEDDRVVVAARRGVRRAARARSGSLGRCPPRSSTSDECVRDGVR
ncbi:hypothetical protein H489_0101720 [Curtobacterium flaccumfaciens UCD-AKU]|uniref:hypothetical protein n=1 Tax=Curtobacterium flaccumfaciens TaxID=2035 RepID=UPI000377149B|nr:hypothetical protein [Curtobacterium flaccumfaciens]EYT66701.1 hypothetical protein H489_0101720 [Curtobacterium flaccumfaciens UCD-AKU]